eukprot:scaffold83273_cov30-Tisochrysis_lutea.AAC.4
MPARSRLADFLDDLSLGLRLIHPLRGYGTTQKRREERADDVSESVSIQTRCGDGERRRWARSEHRGKGPQLADELRSSISVDVKAAAQ